MALQFPSKQLESSFSENEKFYKDHISRKEIEKIIGMRIRNVKYYQRALVHKSIQKNIKHLDPTKVKKYLMKSNETLEFLGDSVLNIIIAERLFLKWPTKDEGFLTRMRTKLVKGKTLAKFSAVLGLGKHILMSKHVQNIGGASNPHMLEDVFEAMLGAMYLDLGFETVKFFVNKIVDTYINEKDLLIDDNYKDQLLRYTQQNSLTLPIYETVLVEGPPHNRTFTMKVIIDNSTPTTSKGKTKKEAEQKAAQLLLKTVNFKNREGC